MTFDLKRSQPKNKGPHSESVSIGSGNIYSHVWTYSIFPQEQTGPKKPPTCQQAEEEMGGDIWLSGTLVWLCWPFSKHGPDVKTTNRTPGDSLKQKQQCRMDQSDSEPALSSAAVCSSRKPAAEAAGGNWSTTIPDQTSCLFFFFW